MLTSIGKSSKSFFIKLLVGIIILPFVFWGMGDVFRGGSQNVIATIDSQKVSTQEFLAHLNRLNLNEKQIKSLPKTDLLEKILSEYIGRKVMAMEIDKTGIIVNDNSLRNIIRNDKLFFKNEKFSRIEYEKFLLKSGLTAPAFEANIAEQESRRQLLSFLAGGIVVPDILIENTFKKENQIKIIKYIDLEKYHLSKKLSKEKMKELYEKNKKLFVSEFKTVQYTKITPQILVGSNDFNESFFKKLDIIENKILDGQSFAESVKENNLIVTSINQVDRNKQSKNKKKIENFSDELFKKIYLIKEEKKPEIIKVDNNFFLVEIKLIEKENKPINDSSVQDALKAQLNFQAKIENNTSILKDISMGGFDEKKLKEFASKKNLELKDYKISSLKQNETFSEGIIKRIFLMKNTQIDLITNSTLTKNFLVLAVNTQYKKIDKTSNEFEKYAAKARLNLINNIYENFDAQLNKKYKVELNQRTIERVKNSF